MMIPTMASAHLPSAGLHTRFVRGLAARIFVHGGRLNVAGHWTFFECSHMFTFFIVKALRLNTHAHTHIPFNELLECDYLGEQSVKAFPVSVEDAKGLAGHGAHDDLGQWFLPDQRRDTLLLKISCNIHWIGLREHLQESRNPYIWW